MLAEEKTKYKPKAKGKPYFTVEAFSPEYESCLKILQKQVQKLTH